MTKFIYLASPFSHKSKQIEQSREDSINLIASKLKKDNPDCVFFLPITQSCVLRRFEPSLGGSFENWKKDDLFIIREKADALWVVMLDGWKESIGIQAEIKCAKRHKKPILYIEVELANA